MTTKYTNEEIQKRIAATKVRREAQKLRDKAKHDKYKTAMQQMHEFRYLHHVFSKGDVTIDVVGNLEGSEFRVFWTVKSKKDRYSFRLAKKELALAWYENNLNRQFSFSAHKVHDEHAIQAAAIHKFWSMALANSIDISKAARNDILTFWQY
jgi:hypothetical protein